MPESRTAQRIKTQRLAALPTAPHIARVFVVQLLKSWHVPTTCHDTAELLASELVTNAVKQTGRVSGAPTAGPTETVTIVTIMVRLIPGCVRIEVWDNDHTPLHKVEQNLDAESGRGLFLVEAMSREWGVYTPKIGGKVIWCDVPFGDEATKFASAAARNGAQLKKREPVKHTSTTPYQAVVDVATLERVIWGLQRLGTTPRTAH